MPEPTPLMQKAAAALFPGDAGERADFLESLLAPRLRPGAVVWTVPRREGELDTLPRESLPAWIPDAVELVRPGVKIGLSPAYAAGEVYPLDFSSVVTGSAMLAAAADLPPAPRVLDLCAAPGGKSILASVLLRPGALLANEVEGRRLGPLRHNLSRCRIPAAFTQRLAPEEWAGIAPAAFSLVIVDAPCSGQSLLAKGLENPGCFHPSTVKGNARRQARILEAAAALVAPGGFLLYTTCTFAPRENEEAVARLIGKAAHLSPVEVPHLAAFRSDLADFPAYRIYPHRPIASSEVTGAGGFAALLGRGGEADSAPPEPLPSALLDYPVSGLPSR